MAQKLGNQFCFYPHLKAQTVTWKNKKVNYIMCYYKVTLNLGEIKAYKKNARSV